MLVRSDGIFVIGSIFLVICVDSLKVLHFVPTLSYSHVAFNGKIAESLIENGHNVTVMLIDIDSAVTSAAAGSAEILRVNTNVSNEVLSQTLWKNPGPFEEASPLSYKIIIKLAKVAQIFTQACKDVVNSKKIVKLLQESEFDVGIVEQYDMCGVGFLRMINVKSIIWLSATAIYRLQPETIGVNYPLSYVPELFAPHSDHMTLIERTLNCGIAGVTEAIHKVFPISNENSIFQQEIGLKNYNLFAEASFSSWILSNTQPFLDFPAPTFHKIMPIGGITVSRPQCSTLNSHWQKVVKQRKFFIVTFGSIAKTKDMPLIIKQSLFHSFAMFPQYSFIVKYENTSTEISQKSNNVYYSKWLPQYDLICHKNYQGIITHGGWSTILESIVHRRPLILVPLFADHFKNAMVIRNKRLGVVIDKNAIDINTFQKAIDEIMNNKRYAQNCVKFSEMLQSPTPVTPSALVSHGIRRAFKASSKFTAINFRLRTSDQSLLISNSFDLFCGILCLLYAIQQ